MRSPWKILCPLIGVLACGTEDRPHRPSSTLPTSDAGDSVEPRVPKPGADGSPSVSPGDYPPGPYGIGNPEVGEVIEDLPLVGFVDTTPAGLATESPFSEATLGTLRDGSARLLLVHTAAVWCTSCRRAAADLGARSAEVLAAGGSVLELLVEGQTGDLPTRDEIATWVETYGLSSSTLAPSDERGAVVFPDREYAYIVDLDSMSVVWRGEGLYATPTVADVAVSAMLDEFL